MSLKSEMDEYNVPKATRPKIFMWGLAGGWATASILLVMLIRCYNQNGVEKDKRLGDWQEIARKAEEAARQQVRTAVPNVEAQLGAYQHSIDSLNRRIDSLTNLKRGV